MLFLREKDWKDVFEGWRRREAQNQGWIDCATKIKGWPDWQSWRQFTASQIKAKTRAWRLFQFTDPAREIPEMFVGPFSGWQSRFSKPNVGTFADLLEIPEQFEFWRRHDGVLSIMNGLPFETEMIGLVREDVGRIVCLEGHHRAVAITLAGRQNKKIDFGDKVKIALADLNKNEVSLLDDVLKRGTSKN